jgi:exodeoxyribonuclease VII large subunit
VAVYSVTQVSHYLKQLLDQDPLISDLWISGEVSNVRPSPTGHSYFTLKDASAQLRCIMFSRGNGIELITDGAAVVAHGRISLYEARGSLDFVTDIVMTEGAGPLSLEFERLKTKLEKEGLFEPSRKRPMPQFPKVIGLVTSPTGAVLQDILKILSRRYPLAEVLLAPTLVQGPEAVPGIISAIHTICADGRAEVIILARGGGSLEDLWAFNEEAVARTIFACPTPVVSAIGHETDYTIADFVADVRAPTPSAAAEMIAPDRKDLMAGVASISDRLNWALRGLSEKSRASLDDAVSRLHRSAPDIALWRRQVDDLLQETHTSASRLVLDYKKRVAALSGQVEALSPMSALRRGYAVVERQPAGEAVSSIHQLKPNDSIKVTVSDGAFPAIANPSVRKATNGKSTAPAGARLFE